MSRADGEVLGFTTIVDSGPATRRWNLVLLSDGFRSDELATRFAPAAQNIASRLFSIPPFTELRRAINIHRVDVASVESGIDDPGGGTCTGSGTMVRTFFDGRLCNRGLPRLTGIDEGLAWWVGRGCVPQMHAAIVVINSMIYGGSGGSVAACTLADGADLIAIHELSHSAFGLGDEYSSWRGCDSGETDRNRHGFTVFDLSEPNLTVHTSRETLIAHKWGRFVRDDTPVPTMRNPDCSVCDGSASPVAPNTTGLFEGSHYYHCDAYRPEFTCLMREFPLRFCRACSEQIRHRLARFMFNRPEDLAPMEIVFRSRNSGKVLDVTAIQLENGVRLQQWDYWGGGNQRWRVEPTGDGFVRLVAAHSGRVADVWGVSRGSGAVVHQWDWWGGENQQWRIEDLGNGYVRLMARHSGQAMDVAGFSRDNGAAIIQWPYHGGTNQQWRFSTADLGVFARHSGKALDIRAVSPDNGARLQQWDWHGGGNQRFRFEDVGEGFYRIICAHSGKVLDVDGSSRRNGGRVHQWDWHGGENQQWRLEPNGDGWWRIIARNSGLCLDVAGVSGATGAEVHQWLFLGGWNQLWRIAPGP